MGDARLDRGAPDAGPDAGHAPWLQPAQARPPSRSAMPWIMALLAISLVAVAAFLLGRGTGPQVAPLPARPLPMATATERPPATVPPSAVPNDADGTNPGEAPALARAAQENDQIAPVGPKAEQLSAATEIAANRRREAALQEALEREAAALRPPPPPPLPPFPRFGPPGQVIQLGTYLTAAQAEAAATRFRERYRGLLSTLPTSVSPFRARGAKQSIYRVQFLTPSQAYSEIVCQRLRAAKKSCIVIY